MKTITLFIFRIFVFLPLLLLLLLLLLSSSSSFIHAQIITQLTADGLSGLVSTTTNNNLITNGLVGLWYLNEGTGSTAIDSSSIANNGSLISSPSYSSQNVNGNTTETLALNGSSQYVSIPFNSVYQTGNNFSYVAWINTSTSDGNAHFIIGQMNETDANDYNSGAKLYLGPGGNNLSVYNPTTSANVIVGNTSISTSVWHLVAFTYNGTNAITYVDGALDTSVSYSPGNFPNKTDGIQFGFNSVTSQAFQGLLYGMRIYNRALSLTEISNIYNFKG